MTGTVSNTPENDRSVPGKSHYDPAERFRQSLEEGIAEERAAALAKSEPVFLAVYDSADLAASRHCIYALIDPRRPRVVMYVGQTTGHALVRLEQHIAECRNLHPSHWCPRHRWLLALKAKGLVPSIAVIETVPEDESLAEPEQEWIRFYKWRGQAELNRNIRLRAMYGFGAPPTPDQNFRRKRNKRRATPALPDSDRRRTP